MTRHGPLTVACSLALFVAAVACGADVPSPAPEAGESTPSEASWPPAAGDRSVLPVRYGTLTERAVDGGADGRNVTAAAESMNEFALDLYRAVVAEKGGNTVVGPYSANFALGMIFAGARGQTADEMAAVELPYGGGALSMVIIVPSDLEAFEAELTNESLQRVISRISEGGIHLSMPRWTARTHVQLNEILARLGMPTAFSPSADFSGMVDGGGLFLAQVEH